MGMSRSQVMFKVEVPLAISVIMGGIRIAAVTSIGITTIATLMRQADSAISSTAASVCMISP
jgi:ABC-type proline/glycine betaine transport system permease subunit